MKNKYIKKIDYIRVFACIAVLLYHLGLLKGGYLAVCTFFVMSGYLTAVSLLNKKEFSFGKYYLGRLKRLYLPLCITVFLTVAVVSLIPSITWMNLKPETTSVLLGYNNYWQLGADLDYFTRHVSSPFMHLWYISILMQFDLVFPLVMIPLKHAARKISKALPLLVTGLFMTASYVLFFIKAGQGEVMAAYYGTFCRLFSLLAGVFLGFFHTYYKPAVNPTKPVRDHLFPVYLLVLSVLFILNDADRMRLGMLLATVFSMRLIDYAAAASSRRRPSDALIKEIAQHSYEIYLVQYPIIFLFQNTKLSAWITIPLTVVLTWIFAKLIRMTENINLSEKNVTQLALSTAVGLTSLLGVYRYIAEKDHTEEMKELEERLEENQKLIEEKKKETEEEKPAEETPQPTEEPEETEEPETTEEPQETPEARPAADTDEAVTEMIKTMPVVGIGDSILLDAVDILYDMFPNGYFDAAISRSLSAGTEILTDLKNQGKLPDTLILCLATNGDFRIPFCEKLMEVVGDREVFWVNAVGADDPAFNEGFAEFAAAYPNIHIVDWEGVSKEHPEYFYPDGIHVVPEAVKDFAEVIYDSVYSTYAEKYNNN